jgi:DNA-binding HxlR family transcriptional regulator
MRRYGEFCPLARALDVVGERWTILIVRELALGPRRFTDLRGGLPGIATNLLADRLRFLEAAGLVERHEVAGPLPGVLYHLAPRGEALVPVLRDLARWGAPLMLEGQGDDACHSRWLVFLTELVYGDVVTDGVAPLTLSVSTGEEMVTVVFDADGARIEPGATRPADLSIEADPDTLFALLSGQLTFDEAKTRGAVLRGGAPAHRRLATLTGRVGLLPPRSSRRRATSPT